MSPALIAPLMAAAGIAALLVFAPMAKAAEGSKSTPGWTLWSCTDGVCRMHGRPLGQTACLLDLASLANVLPKGSRLACVRIQQIPAKGAK